MQRPIIARELEKSIYFVRLKIRAFRGRIMMTRPDRGTGQDAFTISLLVESGRARRCSKPHGGSIQVVSAVSRCSQHHQSGDKYWPPSPAARPARAVIRPQRAKNARVIHKNLPVCGTYVCFCLRHVSCMHIVTGTSLKERAA